MNVGKYILTLAAKEGYSQSDVARRTGISRQMLSYIIAGERKLTLPQALKIESLFSLKTGTLILMQDEDYIKKYQISLRHSLCMKLIEVNAFWSYDNAAEDDISDEDIIEKTLLLLDMDDISRLFELYSRKFVRKVWESRLASQGEYLHSLNMMIAQYYFNIQSPEQFLRRREATHIHKVTQDA